MKHLEDNMTHTLPCKTCITYVMCCNKLKQQLSISKIRTSIDCIILYEWVTQFKRKRSDWKQILHKRKDIIFYHFQDICNNSDIRITFSDDKSFCQLTVHSCTKLGAAQIDINERFKANRLR
jgi:hypothetical protein